MASASSSSETRLPSMSSNIDRMETTGTLRMIPSVDMPRIGSNCTSLWINLSRVGGSKER